MTTANILWYFLYGEHCFSSLICNSPLRYYYSHFTDELLKHKEIVKSPRVTQLVRKREDLDS